MPECVIWMPTNHGKGLPRCREVENLQKMVKNWSILGETYIVKVLCMPAHHPTLPGSYKWAHNTPKGSRTAEKSKIYEKWSKSRNIIGETYFWGYCACQHISLDSLVHINGRTTHRKAPAQWWAGWCWQQLIMLSQTRHPPKQVQEGHGWKFCDPYPQTCTGINTHEHH